MYFAEARYTSIVNTWIQTQDDETFIRDIMTIAQKKKDYEDMIDEVQRYKTLYPLHSRLHGLLDVVCTQIALSCAFRRMQVRGLVMSG